jgi:hypothetical protein
VVDGDDRVQGEGQARPGGQVGGVADRLLGVGGADEGDPDPPQLSVILRR